jgi:cytochrome P450
MADASPLPRAIHETLRFNGVVPFLTREVSETFDFEVLLQPMDSPHT